MIFLIIGLLRVVVKCFYFGAFNIPKIKADTVLKDDFNNKNWQALNKDLATELHGPIKTMQFSAYQRYNIISFRLLFFCLKKIFKNYRKFCQYGIDFNYNNINIGLPIIETYLRSGHAKYQHNYKSAFFYVEAIVYTEHFLRLMKNIRVRDVLLSHENYIYYAIPAEVLVRNGRSLHFISENGYVKASRLFYQFDQFRCYREIFSTLSCSVQRDLKAEARAKLNRRLSGELKVDMDYQELSAYHSERCTTQIHSNINVSVLVALHCFIDNPHAYQKLQYIDFYEWLEELLSELTQNGEFDIYLKTHRDAPKTTKLTALEFSKRYKNTNLLDANVSMRQLVDEGLNIAITGYGSVAHELPYMGIPVISSLYNPHVAYSFSYMKKSSQFYTDAIHRALAEYSKQEAQSQIEEFYAIRNILRNDRLFKDRPKQEWPSIIRDLVQKSRNKDNFDSRLNYEHFIHNT